MPQLSGSAFHRRRSLRNKNPDPSVLHKENVPVGPGPTAAPAPPPIFKTGLLPPQPRPKYAATPTVLGSHNTAPSAVRELFTTPQQPSRPLFGGLTPSRLFRSSTKGWRPSPFRKPTTKLSTPSSVEVHGTRVVHSVMVASLVGTFALFLCNNITHFLFYRNTVKGLSWAFASFVLYAISTLLLITFLGLSEGVFSCEHPRIPLPLFHKAGFRYIGSSRNRIAHLFVSAGISAALVLSTSFCMGFVSRGDVISVLYPLWLGLFCGFSFSYLAQVSGSFTWRFSPTRDTILRRLRFESPYPILLGAVAVFTGSSCSALDLMLGRQIMLALGWLPRSPIFSVSFRTQACTIFAALATMCALGIVCLGYMHMMTTAMNVRDYIPEVNTNTLQVKSSEERSRQAVLRLLDDICPEKENADTGLGALTLLLGLQFFRDIARTSRVGRQIVFSDSNGTMWNRLLAACFAPIKAQTAQPSSSNININFVNCRAVAWACEALSHFVVASRNEDDFGIAQRSFVYVVINLLHLKEFVDIARERLRIRRASNSMAIPAKGAAKVLQTAPQDVYFAPDTVSAVVGDAVDLALVRIVDAFRAHLKGFLVGAEPHWDRRLDQSLQAVLASCDTS